MGVEGFYYLHENKDLIFKREKPEIETGGFVKRVWPFDPSDRAGAYCILIEAAIMDVQPQRLADLLERWKITDDDCLIAGGHYSMLLMQNEAGQSEQKWAARWADKSELVGYGPTAFRAMVELVRKNTGSVLRENGF